MLNIFENKFNPEVISQSEAGLRLLRAALSSCGFDYDSLLPIIKNENGKPYFECGKPFFNISHSNNTVVCAVSDAEVGIDVEFVSDKILKVKSRLLKKEDGQNCDVRQLTKIWTIKESVLKCAGVGLTRDMRRVFVSGDFKRAEFDGKTYDVETRGGADYFISCSRTRP